QLDQNELQVKLNERIVLNPIAAKRLAIQLEIGIRDYESRFGSPDGKAEIRTILKPTPPLHPPLFRSEKGADKVHLLFQFLEDHQIRPAFESSCEFLERKLLGNRFLLGFEKRMIHQNPDGKILDICGKMNMPKDFLVALLENLPEAKIVGFGFGEEGETFIVKAYLEFGDRFYRAIKTNRYKPEPYLSHLGFKWHADDSNKKALTKYTCFPGYSSQEILERLDDFYKDKNSSPLEIIRGILTLAASRIGTEKFLYLDVKEENNPRLSFDINLYAANLQMKEIYSFLLEMCRYYSIPSEQFHNLYESMKTQIFGHLAGGVDREGRDFLTIYFGK
ncbi:MAG TPA: DUF3467 domain-containing protein, partial [Desulfobacterales bacterium]|nr:DUF3467 domain-containing protein [Desulfobacterales bacterium]